MLPANTSLVVKGSQSGICIGGIAFAVSGLWLLGEQRQVKPKEIPDFWAFVRAAPPAAPHLRGLHSKFLVSLGILLIAALFMFAHAIVVAFGMGTPQ